MNRFGRLLPRIACWLVAKAAPGSELKVYRTVPTWRAKWYRGLCTGDCLEPEILDGSELTFDLNTKPEVGDYALVFDPDEPLGDKLIVKKLVSRKLAGVESLFLYSSDRLPLILLTARHEIRGTLSYAVIPPTSRPVDAELSRRINAENAAVASAAGKLAAERRTRIDRR